MVGARDKDIPRGSDGGVDDEATGIATSTMDENGLQNISPFTTPFFTPPPPGRDISQPEHDKLVSTASALFSPCVSPSPVSPEDLEFLNDGLNTLDDQDIDDDIRRAISSTAPPSPLTPHRSLSPESDHPLSPSLPQNNSPESCAHLVFRLPLKRPTESGTATNDHSIRSLKRVKLSVRQNTTNSTTEEADGVNEHPDADTADDNMGSAHTSVVKPSIANRRKMRSSVKVAEAVNPASSETGSVLLPRLEVQGDKEV